MMHIHYTPPLHNNQDKSNWLFQTVRIISFEHYYAMSIIEWELWTIAHFTIYLNIVQQYIRTTRLSSLDRNGSGIDIRMWKVCNVSLEFKSTTPLTFIAPQNAWTNQWKKNEIILFKLFLAENPLMIPLLQRNIQFSKWDWGEEKLTCVSVSTLSAWSFNITFNDTDVCTINANIGINGNIIIWIGRQ